MTDPRTVMRQQFGVAVTAAATALLLAGGTAAAVETAAHGPDLGVTILRTDGIGHAAISAGDVATVSIGVHNLRGDAEARDATLTVVVPAGLTVENARPAPQRTEAENEAKRFVWDLGTLAAGAFPRLFELDLRAAPVLTNGSELYVSASAAGAGDVNHRNDRAALRLAVKDPVAYLVVETNLGSVPFTVSRSVEFAVELNNFGTVPATGCELTLTLPPRARFLSSTPAALEPRSSAVTWKLGDIPVGESRKVQAAIVLDNALTAAAQGSAGQRALLEFDFAATTSTPLADPEAGRIKITRYPELAGSNVSISLNVEGVENAAELPVGKDVTYDILYGNYGNEPARKVTAVLNLPAGLQFVSASVQPASRDMSERFPGGVIAWDLRDLEVGQSDMLRAKVHVASVDQPRFVEAIIAAGGGQDVGAKGKIARAWYGPALARATPVAGSISHVVEVQSPRWIVAVAIALALVAAAFVALLIWRHRRNTR